MKYAFFVASAGDTDLALATAKTLRALGHDTVFISLTKTAAGKIVSAQKLASITHVSLYDLLVLNSSGPIIQRCTRKQLTRIGRFISKNRFSQAFIGMPSERHIETAMQIAETIHHIPVVFAAEFMFKPHPEHSIWKHRVKLQTQSNVHWVVPLENSQLHYHLTSANSTPVGHFCFDRALRLNSVDILKTRHDLQIAETESLGFLSGTTQPLHCDLAFITTLFEELPNHPQIQIRLGLHPGIENLDAYLEAMIHLYENLGASPQFKIILPPSWREKFKHPELFFDDISRHSLFIFQEINGETAAYTADRVMQSSPGALLNEALIRGKAVYTNLSPEEEPALPTVYFSKSPALLFRAQKHTPLTKMQFGLDEKMAVGENCAQTMLTRHR